MILCNVDNILLEESHESRNKLQIYKDNLKLTEPTPYLIEMRYIVL